MGFTVFSRLVPTIILLLLLGIVGALTKALVAWNKNNQSPQQVVEAEVLSKRERDGHHQNGNTGVYSSSIWYYITFGKKGEDNMEFSVSESEYKAIAQGNRGKLSFQGTRYLGFEPS